MLLRVDDLQKQTVLVVKAYQELRGLVLLQWKPWKPWRIQDAAKRWLLTSVRSLSPIYSTVAHRRPVLVRCL